MFVLCVDFRIRFEVLCKKYYYCGDVGSKFDFVV